MISVRGKGSRRYDRPELEDIGAKMPNRAVGKKVAGRQQKKNRIKKQNKRPNYYQYMQSRAWKNKRSVALKYHGAVCSECKSTKCLTVHHLSYSRLGHEKMKDLQILCWTCHQMKHEAKHIQDDPLWAEYNSIVGLRR